jgi:hypothetical protein
VAGERHVVRDRRRLAAGQRLNARHQLLEKFSALLLFGYFDPEETNSS